MPSVAIPYFLLFLLCLLFSAFFSSSEAAFLSLQRLRLRHMANQKVPRAQQVAQMAEEPERFLPTILLGNNLVNTAAAAIGTALAVAFLGSRGQGVLAAIVGVTVLLLIFGEVLPKTVATRHAERLAFLYVQPLRIIGKLLFPFTKGLQFISQGAASLFGGDIKAIVSEEEIKTLIILGREEGVVEHSEAEMLQKVFKFGDRQVREVMTPRTEVVWVEKGTTLKEFLDIYSQHPHTRFPVYEETVDNVVGILSVKDVFKAMIREELSPLTPVTPLARRAHFVPETKRISALLPELRKLGVQMAIVIDEFGGVAGLVTMRQMVEEIVGPVGQEGLESAEEFRVIGKNTFQVEGGMRVDEANEKMGLELPEGEDYETVAGFVLHTLGHIPQEGEYFYCNNLKLVVARMRGVKIEEVTITKMPQEGSP